jgi:hypothetical protein
VDTSRLVAVFLVSAVAVAAAGQTYLSAVAAVDRPQERLLRRVGLSALWRREILSSKASLVRVVCLVPLLLEAVALLTLVSPRDSLRMT